MAVHAVKRPEVNRKVNRWPLMGSEVRGEPYGEPMAVGCQRREEDEGA